MPSARDTFGENQDPALRCVKLKTNGLRCKHRWTTERTKYCTHHQSQYWRDLGFHWNGHAWVPV